MFLGTIVFIIILGVLILSHEFGHFIVARMLGVRVEKFAIGFGPSLVKVPFKGTDFLICLVPFGGYVKLAGDNRDEWQGKEDEFFSQSIGRRALIIFAGPLFNYLLAILAFWFTFIIGYPTFGTRIGGILDDSPAQRLGLQVADEIVSVNGKRVNDWHTLTTLIRRSSQDIQLEVEREGKIINIIVSPQEKELPNIFGKKVKARYIGITPDPKKIIIIKKGVFTAFLYACKEVISSTIIIFQGIFYIFMGVTPVREAIAGPIGIYNITVSVVQAGLIYVFALVGSLGVSLAFINLLPLPILDGGHLFFLGLEKLRGRPLSKRAEEIVTNIGIVIILTMVILVMYLDISKLWVKS